MKIKILFFALFVIILSSCTNNVVPDDKVKITVENKVKDIGYIDKIYYRTSDKLIGGWQLVWDESDEIYHPTYSSFYLNEEGNFQFKIRMLYFDVLPVSYRTELFTSLECTFGHSYDLYFDGYSLNYRQ